MKEKNKENQSAQSMEESLGTLFGREEDLTDAELDEELDACGIDPQELQADVHKQLLSYAKHHYLTLGKRVPENLEKTLRALRPASAADKGKAVIKSAETLVDSFFDTAKAKSSEFVRNALPTQGWQPQFVFRNKRELSAADRSLLESEQEDVDSSGG